MIGRSRRVPVADVDDYADWAPVYPPRAHNPLMEVEQAAVLRLLPPLQGLAVLDAGCGTGRYARVAVECGAARVVGVDRSAAMLAHASAPGARLVRADVSALPLPPGTFDVVISGLVLPDVARLAPVISEWRRVLRPGGAIVYSTLHPTGEQLGWRRTFATPRGPRTLAAHWHALAEHHAACEAAGLSIDTLAEPGLGAGTQPVALVVRARRAG